MLSVSNVIDDGSTIAIPSVHHHPDEISRVSLDRTRHVHSPTRRCLVAHRAKQCRTGLPEHHGRSRCGGTTSDTTFIEINRTTSENESHQTDDGTDNETGDGTGAKPATTPKTARMTALETKRTTARTVQRSLQPTYDPSDMGQFWRRVPLSGGQNITQVDGLSTAAVEARVFSQHQHERDAHHHHDQRLPDHDFESTLACTQANDCTLRITSGPSHAHPSTTRRAGTMPPTVLRPTGITSVRGPRRSGDRHQRRPVLRS